MLAGIIRYNKFHVITILFFAGLMIRVFHQPDSLAWISLFFLIIVNAGLFMLGKAVPAVCWLVVVVGILGIIMSLPHLWRWFFSDMEADAVRLAQRSHIEPVFYFGSSVLFSSLQIHRSVL